ncbi:carbohydrate ABC transporter substrate-binding protein, CUT1 family [Lutibacter agarilyticus]|uniref:Carbohydrate ABC transporter substrate-binding protein, CUT1 family n=1 Tax=Lutibacter agarilyticus TaxID=1109740 RepID=A0A238VAX2_9FLAO|nr:sugar ABC transporter substrate-binding protein [Lutibacter agarilyticus]SNR31284.1 carbohydrate ABC transporter substrate-binding protein, CUT1 family [Lutibacter agarilyticus]
MKSNKFRIAVRKFDAFESSIEKIWKLFCKKTGCKLELEAVPLDLHPLYDTILKEDGLKNGVWDVSLINTDCITEAFTSNSVEDLTSYIEKNPPEDFPNGWSRSLLYKQEFDDKIVGLPFHDGPECLIYRKDLFESIEEGVAYYREYGKPLEIPKTWDDLMEVAEFFNRPEENLYGTTFAAYPDGHNTVFDFCLQLWTRNGELFDEDKKIKLNSVAAIEGMEFYRKALKNTKAIHPDSCEFDSVKSGMAFANGNLAMMVNWFGFASMCEFLEDSKVKGNVDIANVPAGPTGEGTSLNAYWMYVIGAGSKQKDVAYEFIKFAVNQANDKLLTLEGAIGCRKSTWHDTDVNNEVPYYYKLEELHKNTRSLPRKSNWSEIADVIDQLVLEVINTSKDIKTILDKAQLEIDRVENI